MKPKVLIQQRYIPKYRVPFFNLLSEYVDLTLLYTDPNDPVSTDQSLNSDISQLTFLVKSSFEVLNNCIFCSPGKYHYSVFDIAREFNTDVIIASPQFILPILAHPQLRYRYKKLCVKSIAWGCTGYEINNFSSYKKNQAKSISLFKKPRGYFQRISKYKAANLIDGYLAYSQKTADFWNKIYDIDMKKISIAYNAIDTSGYIQSSSNRKSSYSEELNFTFLGRTLYTKNIDNLLKAFSTLEHNFKNIHLKIIGDGPFLNELKKLSESLKIKNIKFYGSIYNQNQLHYELNQSDICVLPGLGGLGINSAMAAGLPVICGNADGTEEHLVIENKTGFRFDGSLPDLIKCMEKAILNKNELVTMGEAAKNMITNQYNLDKMVDSFLERIDIVMKN